MDRLEIGQRFLNHETIPGVRFKHNDSVRVTSGEFAGQFGSLVTVVELDPEPQFVLELATGHDIQVLQSQLESADT